jgi:vancomycin resistance protein YoaR
MKNYASPPTTYSRSVLIVPQILTALAGGLVIFTLLMGALALGYSSYYSERIYPGVWVAGINLSGLEPAEAAVQLANHFEYPESGKIILRDREHFWLVSPAQLGFELEPVSTAVASFNIGRQGNPLTRALQQFNAWYYGTTLTPQYILDESTTQSFLTGIAEKTNLPVIEASLSVEGINVIAQPGQVGRTLELVDTRDILVKQLQTMQDGEINLVITETHPDILDASQSAQTAQQILSAPLTLTYPETQEDVPGPWTFEPDFLAGMLSIEKVTTPESASYQVGLNTEVLRVFLENLAPELEQTKQNARVIFNDDTLELEVIQPAVTGRSLNVDATLDSINQKLISGEHNFPLEFTITPPEVSDQTTGAELGITELVSAHTSYFYGSSAARIQNIQTAASQFHGVLIPPGASFSMGETLGDVSLDNGYAEALIIYGDRTIEGVGGGVCQVSTTLFRTAFFGGYAISERHSHAYRVYYYELRADGGVNTELAGLDATVYFPLVDFKFINDTPYWLLMETYVNPAARTLTWKFYSTSDGRTVDWQTTGLQNVVEPPEPYYEENPELAKGEVNQVDWAVEGADVSVSRTVTRGGEVLYADTFHTHYMPWRAVYEYGPGTKGMPPEKGDGNEEEE